MPINLAHRKVCITCMYDQNSRVNNPLDGVGHDHYLYIDYVTGIGNEVTCACCSCCIVLRKNDLDKLVDK